MNSSIVKISRPTRASCSAGKALVALSAADFEEYKKAVVNPKIKAETLARWLTLNSNFVIRQRMMQRHRVGEGCACEYDEVES